ncbi:hypothetical protein FB45DRAFT_905307 [Roridomyces roridus]|uniref:MYND-type domain-containing protein n=1 Tax=Roridomyces roridus TaxID=1738132 RepID=A0AAD7C5R4_9AGAR|nr:hypothetical protein FB45DRAFT_905307 [Roridomyces roridus]
MSEIAHFRPPAQQRNTKLKYQVRQCANCSKPESDVVAQGERFKVCGRCKIARYCDSRCQKKDWPKHKPRCELQASQNAMAEEADELNFEWALGQAPTLSMGAIQPLLHEWVTTYRPLLCLSLLYAQGLWDRPPCQHPATDEPQVFYVPLSTVPGISEQTKARAAFHIGNKWNQVQVVPISELRAAATDRTHRMYDQDLVHIISDFDRHLADRQRVAVAASAAPFFRMSMVLHSVYFHNGIGAMQFHKNWYFEHDRRMDYSGQWQPPAGDWLGLLQETVAAGKGWSRSDAYYNSNIANITNEHSPNQLFLSKQPHVRCYFIRLPQLDGRRYRPPLLSMVSHRPVRA